VAGHLAGQWGGHNSGGSDRGVKEKRTWETLVRFVGGRKGKERRGRVGFSGLKVSFRLTFTDFSPIPYAFGLTRKDSICFFLSVSEELACFNKYTM